MLVSTTPWPAPRKKRYSTQTLEKPPNSLAPISESRNSQKRPSSGPKNTLYKVQSEVVVPHRWTRADAYRLADVYGFFYHALPPVGVLTLEDLHAVVRDVWLTRHDEELEQERAARRKGRSKSTKEAKLEEIKLRETEEYRSGIGEFQASPSPAILTDVSHQRSRISQMNLQSNYFENGTRKKSPTSSYFDSSGYLALIPQWPSYLNLANTTRCG